MSNRKFFVLFLFLPLALTSGCSNNSKTNEARTASTPSPREASAASQTPEAGIYVDEAMLSKPFAIIGGTVQNVSDRPLEKLSVEVELRKREDGSLVKREAVVEPADLAPGGRGKFALKVLSDEWSGSRVVGLRSGSRQEEIAFKTFPGAKRPPERIPERVTVVKSPKQRAKSKGDEFLNTPDDPIKVP